jgi:acetyl esterase/lipase
MAATRLFETFLYSGDTGLALDVFQPAGESRRCAVLVFHGGGWRVGSRQAVRDRASGLAAAGFTAVTVQYRLLGTAAWPAPLADATAALNWVRDNAAKLDIESDNVVVQGHSAGGHIALMTGTLDAATRPAAIAAYYPAIGFYPASAPSPAAEFDAPASPPTPELDEFGRLPSWMLFPPETGQERIAAASPIDLIDASFPATILLHGTADTMIPARASVNLHNRLVELEVPSDLHVYADRGHEFDRAPSVLSATVHATASFFERVVVNRADSDAEADRFAFRLDPS